MFRFFWGGEEVVRRHGCFWKSNSWIHEVHILKLLCKCLSTTSKAFSCPRAPQWVRISKQLRAWKASTPQWWQFAGENQQKPLQHQKQKKTEPSQIDHHMAPFFTTTKAPKEAACSGRPTAECSRPRFEASDVVNSFLHYGNAWFCWRVPKRLEKNLDSSRVVYNGDLESRHVWWNNLGLF